MGILELHFHDSEIKFAPSMTNTRGKEATEGEESSKKSSRLGFGRSRSSAESESSDEESTMTPSETSTAEEEFESSSGGSTAKKGLGVIVGLAFLVAVAAMAKKMADSEGMEGMESDEYGSESTEESIKIAD